jgi:tight adherence protein C
MIPLLVAILATLTLGALVAGLRSSKSDIARRVAAIDTASMQRADESQFLKRFVGEAGMGDLRSKLIEAGWYKTTVAGFYLRWGICVAVAFGIGLGLLFMAGGVNVLVITGTAVLCLCGLMVPRALLDRAIAARKIAIHRMIPDWLDTISTTVEAGTALNAALAMSLEAIRGPLADELREVLADVRIGRSRADALTAMAQRVRQVDLTSVVTAMVQTERLGGNIGHVLDELAVEARHRRLMRAEELAAQLPVKMVIPMALFMLPSLMVMIFGPVVADLVTKVK